MCVIVNKCVFKMDKSFDPLVCLRLELDDYPPIVLYLLYKFLRVEPKADNGQEKGYDLCLNFSNICIVVRANVALHILFS